MQSVDFTDDVFRIGLLGEQLPASTGNQGVWSTVETLNTTVDVATTTTRSRRRANARPGVTAASPAR